MAAQESGGGSVRADFSRDSGCAKQPWPRSGLLQGPSRQKSAPDTPAAKQPQDSATVTSTQTCHHLTSGQNIHATLQAQSLTFYQEEEAREEELLRLNYSRAQTQVQAKALAALEQ